MQSLLLLLSLVAVALGVGYAPVPQAAPAAQSYGNPLPNQFSPVYVPQNGQQGWNSQQNGFNNIPNTFNSVPRNGQSQGMFGGNANGLSGNGAVASLASDDDWDSVISARGVRNFKFRPNRHH